MGQDGEWSYIFWIKLHAEGEAGEPSSETKRVLENKLLEIAYNIVQKSEVFFYWWNTAALRKLLFFAF